MAARFQQLKAGGDNMKHTRSLPTIAHRDDLVVIRGESMRASTAALNWSGSMAMPVSLKGSRALSLDELGTIDDETQIIAPVGRVTWPLAITAVAAILGASFPHGWNTGVLNAPSHLIMDFINGSYVKHFKDTPTEQILNIMWATTVSIYLVGGFIGAFSAGWLAEKFGRKRALLLLHVFNYASAVMFGFCQYANSIFMLILARAIVGFACGAGSGIVPMYLTEIAPINVRGAMGVLHQFALTCGILMSQIFGMRQILGNELLWPFLLAATAVPCALSMVITIFFPDSPRYLFVTKGDREGAEKALRKFRGTEDVSMDIREMEMEQKLQEQDPEWSFKELMRAKTLRMPLLIVCSLACCQQLSGINVVFYYSNSIFLASGIPTEYVQYAVLATGIINVLMTAISIPLMEKSGRRPLLLGGMIVMLISLAIITVALSLQDRFGFLAYFSLTCIITFVIGFAIGLGSIPQFIGGELFMQGPRPPAMSLAGFLNWLCNFLVGITFPSMQLAMGEYSFCVFIGIVLLFLVFLWKFLPETKNKTYQDIYKLFNNEPESLDQKPIFKNGSLLNDVMDARVCRSEGNLNFHKSASEPANTRILLKPDVELKPMINGKVKGNQPENEALLKS